MQFLKFSSKGFVFVLEVIIALVIFASFLQVSFYAPNSTENPLQKIELKQLTNSIVSYLDYNGFMLSALDSSLSDQEKMDQVD